MLWVAVVQAVTAAMFGPFAPVMIDRLPEIMLMIEAGTKKGEMRRGPRSASSMAFSAIPSMPPGSVIINTGSVNSYDPGEELLDYASTKGAIVAFTRSLALQLAEDEIAEVGEYLEKRLQRLPEGYHTHLGERGVDTWVMGTVEQGEAPTAADLEDPDYVQGAKGVDGGAVRLLGSYAS